MWFGVGLGGNLPGTPSAFRSAVRSLSSDGRLFLTGLSRWYRTVAWEVPAPPYWNLCAVGTTGMGSAGFFSLLEKMEHAVPRRGKGKVWPRTLDIDLLFFIPAPAELPSGLILPHPSLKSRPVLQVILSEACRNGNIPFSFSGIPYPPGHPLAGADPGGYSRCLLSGKNNPSLRVAGKK
ncbi:MAG: 2-amino-4-hydroxy-6-hydroxymethyldihydropteridine diphosphokinase [Leptospirales bacterium]